MRAFKPLIGITSGYNYKKNSIYLKNGYYEGIDKAGGAAVLIPFTQDIDVLEVYIERLDGFLISGGPDVDPNIFGEGIMPYNGEISPCRDFIEMYIIKSAMEKNKPLFGICRGIQIMNIAMGGTIYQDIHAQNNGKQIFQHSQNAPLWYPTHDIKIKKGSKLFEAFGKEDIRVNTFHHQAVKDLAPGFEMTAQSADGIIEAIEHTSQKYAVGVQWHPELMWHQDGHQLKLFRSFIEASAG